MSRIDSATRLALHIRDGFHCTQCTGKLCTVKPQSILVNRYRPRCRGGSDQPRNLYTACTACTVRRRGAVRWLRMVAPPVAPLTPYLRAARRLLEGRTFGQALFAAQRLYCKGGK